VKHTQPSPAQIDWRGEVPQAPAFGDLYHPRVGALAQAQHVFLQGNDLPARWQGRERFVVLETGFGLGHNFLATWQAWRTDPARCTRLHYVAIELHPPRADDLARSEGAAQLPALAAALRAAWPPAVGGLHSLDFDGGALQLLLALGDVREWLPRLHMLADAIYLDGFAPDRNPAMWSLPVLKALGRRAAPGATAATWSVVRPLREGLRTAGFEIERAQGIGGKREVTHARFAPRPGQRRVVAPRPVPKSAIVVGAGVAGAAVAQALLRAGLPVRVFDRHAEPAAEASGNPAALFHASVGLDDGPHHRLLRAAALHAAREYGPLIEQGRIPGRADGLLWLDHRPGGVQAMHDLLAARGWPAEFASALDADAAAALAGAPLAAPAWWLPPAGWIDPGAWVRHALDGAAWHGNTAVHAVTGEPGAWTVRDADDRPLATAELVVVASAAGAQPLLAPWGAERWPCRSERGQVSLHRGNAPSPLRVPVSGDGYALPLPDGSLLCGATRGPLDTATDVRAADHAFNRERAMRLTGLSLSACSAEPAAWQGRAALRVTTPDRLPLCGAMATGLYVLTALGSRGITLAPLLGRVIAAQALGAPVPLERDLLASIDPARYRP
jgi:tRNA 5-methylaminomethyl-2-thiouridine biosynthesis bifunctional protein